VDHHAAAYGAVTLDRRPLGSIAVSARFNLGWGRDQETTTIGLYPLSPGHTPVCYALGWPKGQLENGDPGTIRFDLGRRVMDETPCVHGACSLEVDTRLPFPIPV